MKTRPGIASCRLRDYSKRHSVLGKTWAKIISLGVSFGPIAKPKTVGRSFVLFTSIYSTILIAHGIVSFGIWTCRVQVSAETKGRERIANRFVAFEIIGSTRSAFEMKVDRRGSRNAWNRLESTLRAN